MGDGRPSHRSVSQFNSFTHCSLSYFLGRVRRLPRAPAPWLFQGTAVHEAISYWELSRREADSEQVLAVFRASWDEGLAKAREEEPNQDAWQRSGVKKVETDIRDRHQRGLDQTLAYMEYAKSDPLEIWIRPDTGQPASEVEFEEDFGGVLVKGFIDLIMWDPRSGELLVRDIKTGVKKPAGWFQLATYRHALRKKFDVDPWWGDYWMAKDAKPCSPIPLDGVSETLISSQFQVMDWAERSGLYTANIGDHCARCDVARHCPFAGGTPPEGIPALGT